MDTLERELEAALLRLHCQWKSVPYHATYFKRMLTRGDPIYKGPVGTVKHLLGKNLTEKSGFERLKNAGKLEWTIEVLVQDKKWQRLFEPWEINRASERTRGAKAN